MNQIYWDKLRVLVTNRCNYRCSFCHNEGQDKALKSEQITFDEFKTLINVIEGQPISELNFSGGEPFLNAGIVNMIEYACNKLSCDISCATNLSLISDSILKRLSSTRVKFNIQFPFVDECLFKRSTGNGSLANIMTNISIVKRSGIKIGLNTVIQSRDTESVEDMVKFAINEELPLKLLPQIGSLNSSKYSEWVFPILKKYATSITNKNTGAVRWTLEDSGHKTSVLYINSPCFTKDIETCRNFGEVRILPGMYIQPCISKSTISKLDFTKGKKHVINQFSQLWNDFTTC